MSWKPNPKKAESPIEVKKRQLAEKEAANRAKLQKCQQFLDDAPRRAEEMARAQREKLIESASRTDRPRGRRPATLPDPWRTLEANVAVPAQHKRTRSERRKGRLLFFFLLLVLLGVSYALYVTIQHS